MANDMVPLVVEVAPTTIGSGSTQLLNDITKTSPLVMVVLWSVSVMSNVKSPVVQGIMTGENPAITPTTPAGAAVNFNPSTRLIWARAIFITLCLDAPGCTSTPTTAAPPKPVLAVVCDGVIPPFATSGALVLVRVTFPTAGGGVVPLLLLPPVKPVPDADVLFSWSTP